MDFSPLEDQQCVSKLRPLITQQGGAISQKNLTLLISFLIPLIH